MAIDARVARAGGPAVSAFLTAATAAWRNTLGRNLAGIYVHGSLATGAFNPRTSDIDVMVTTRSPTDGPAHDRITELQSLSPPVVGLMDRDSEFHGGFASLAWKHAFSEVSSATFTASYDVRMRDEVVIQPHEEVLDLAFQHNFSLGRHRIVWGLGYRRTTDNIQGGFAVTFDPVRSGQSLVSGFAQDDVTLIDTRLHAIVGVKVESYDSHSPEYQPNLRLLWTPSPRQTVWASAARALTDPGRVDQGIRANSAAFSTCPSSW